MRMLRIVFTAAIVLILVTGCIRHDPSRGGGAVVVESPPPPLPPPPPPPPGGCDLPKPQPGDVVRIPVADDATIPQAYQVVAIGQGSRVEWYLASTPGVTKKLDIDLPLTPSRFVKTHVSDMQTRVVRNGVGKYECEPHYYKIRVWINDVEVPGDPILIIRE